MDGIENDASKNLFFSGNSLSNCYLATIWGYIDPQSHVSNSSSIVACIVVAVMCLLSLCLKMNEGLHFTEPFLSNVKEEYTYKHTD
jgi:hypothetical protein